MIQENVYCLRLREQMRAQECNEEYIELCVSYAQRLLGRNLPVIFDAVHIGTIFKLESVKTDYYSFFYITGRSGKRRRICAPSKRMKARQRWILENILEKQQISPYCEGFVKEHSIVTNARCHVNKSQVLSIDIQDFFPSITQKQVSDVFEELGYTREVADCLAQLCCNEGVLPQGAPTSPYLANLVCRGMDEELAELSAKHGVTFTRYADDMTFSGDGNLAAMLPEIGRIIGGCGFQLNEKKTRLQSGACKLITGLVVEDGRVKVPKSYKRKLRQEIYYCSRFGVAAHLENSGAKKAVHFKEYLYGKAYYIKMVEPAAGEAFLRQLDQIPWDI